MNSIPPDWRVKMHLPTTIDDFIFSNPSSERLIRKLVSGQVKVGECGKTGIVLYGTYGTGKTTLAKLLPELMESGYVALNHHARDEGLDPSQYFHLTSCGLGDNSTSVLSAIKARRHTAYWFTPSGTQYEVLDEVDMLTKAAQASLKALMTEMSRCTFIMTTNHLAKVDRGIVDRSYFVEMNAASPDLYLHVGRRIATSIGVTDAELTDEELLRLATAAKGSMREFGFAITLYR